MALDSDQNRKIWLGIFLAMFIVPEILWSPVGNFYYQFIKGMRVSNVLPFRNNFLQNPDYFFWLKLIFVIQSIGLLGAIVIVSKYQHSKWKWITIVILLCVLLLMLFVLLYAFLNSYNIG